jgi:hypothetical protein
MLNKFLATILTVTTLTIISGVAANAASYRTEQCPVIGNANTKVYYTTLSPSYEALRSGKAGINNTHCFPTVEAARQAGYSSLIVSDTRAVGQQTKQAAQKTGTKLKKGTKHVLHKTEHGIEKAADSTAKKMDEWQQK